MNAGLKDNFVRLWKKFFGDAELPIPSRPCVAEDVLTFSAPIKRFERMVGYTEERFLVTDTWSAIRKSSNKRDEVK